MDLVQRFIDYANDFERSYADGDWCRLAQYFASDAVYESATPEPLAFRVTGRSAILERFRAASDAFDRRFDSRCLSFAPPRAEGTRVTIEGEVVYGVAGVPPFRLPFREVAEYRGGEILRLEDTAPAEVVDELGRWMAQHGAKLRP